MEKMNQVSVSEFMSKSKEEMYDMAVEMVKKYNRLVDICNDSAERMAELMAKDDINEFKKGLQSKEIGEFKIQKLADIVVWADGKIRDGGYNEEKYKSDAATAYYHVKAYELWRIRDVALDAMTRHTVYSNALNMDIAGKDKQIEKLEKEIEGRKKAFNDLREEMANRYIAIETHNDICKTYEEKIEGMESSIGDRDSVMDGLYAEIERRQAENEKLKVDLIHEREKNERLAKAHAELENDMRKVSNQVKYLEKELEETCKTKELDLKNHNKRDMALVDELAGKNDLIKNLVQEIEYYKNQERIRTDQLRATESKVDQLSREKEEKEKDHGKSGFTEYIKYVIAEEEGKFKAELNKRFSEEVSKISQERTEEELAKAKLNEKFGVGGIVDEFKEGVPCGEDAIE